MVSSNPSFAPIQPLMEIMRFSLIPIFSLYISLFLSLPVANSQSDSCTTKLSVSSQIPFNTTGLSCFSAWSSEDFILRFGETGSNWSFVLSTPDNNGAYISIGFSPNGRMVGSSAIVGWVSGTSGTAKQYYLGGTNSRSCPPDQGNLKLVKGSLLILSKNSRLYLAFQLAAVPQTNVIYAVGPGLPGSNGYLPQHRNMGSGTISFSGGGGTNSTTGGGDGDGDGDGGDDDGNETLSPKKRGDNGGDDENNGGRKDSKSSSSTTLNSVKRHGLAVLIGWGILMPIGVAMARFGKKCDPFWFYSHVIIQAIGFIVGTIGIVLGFGLDDDEGGEGNVDIHKALGVAILVFGCLQVMAILVRPTIESKVRRYWNWYHHYVGRGAILLVFVNIFYGFHISHENEAWSYIYGIFIGIFGVLYLVLEEWRKKNS